MDNKPVFDSRTFVAILLSIVVFIGWQKYLAMKYPGPKKEVAAPTTEKTPEKKAEVLVQPILKPTSEEKTWVYEDSLRKMTVSSRGGRIKEIILKKYADQYGQIKIVDERSPGLLMTHLEGLSDLDFSSADYSLVQSTPEYVRLEAELAGIRIAKTITPKKDQYTVEAVVEVFGANDKVKNVGMDFGLRNIPFTGGGFFSTPHAIGEGIAADQFLFDLGTGKERKHFTSTDLVDVGFDRAHLMAVSSRYFAVALENQSEVLPNGHGYVTKGELVLGADPTQFFIDKLPLYTTAAGVIEDLKAQKLEAGLVGSRVTVTLNNPGGAKPETLAHEILEKTRALGTSVLRASFPVLNLDSKLQYKVEVYAGPKKLEYLSALGESGREIVDYGMFSFLAFPMLKLMNWFHEIFKNWGVAIILLTLLVRIITLPLAIASFRSMKNMQKLQPELAKLRERYKDNKEKIQMETMRLMKENNANPMLGCLPLFLQMPVFFALFQLLQNSIELFQAPFILWIHDLSLKDPYYVLPVLMGITMFIQQKITPSQMDPAQQKAMLIMPVIFSAMMMGLPSGLTLYIFVSTLFGILQQTFMMRDKATTGQPLAKPANS